MLYTSTGTLSYSTTSYRLVLEVDQELADYYRSLIPPWLNPQRQRWGAHVTVVRETKEMPLILEPWGRYDGEGVGFQYDPEIKMGKVYFWLNVFSKRLEEIRMELGLPVTSEYTRPPDGYMKCFHCTIANMKDLHSPL